MEHLTEPLVHPGTTLPAVRAVYQPIVDLTDGSLVAFEALARGPAGSALESPAALFASAREAGHEAELDWLCRATAFRGALQARLPASTTLFVNAEPRWLTTACPPQLASVLEQARALIAHDLGDTGPDRERRFAFTITYDRDVVVRSARTLLGRIARLR